MILEFKKTKIYKTGIGSKEIFKKFAWLPKKIEDSDISLKYVWLEFYYSCRIYKDNHNIFKLNSYTWQEEYALSIKENVKKYGYLL